MAHQEREREVWRHRESGELFVVELEGGRVAAVHGPVAPEELTDDMLAFRRASHGRTPAFTEEAVRIEERRDDYEVVPRPDDAARGS
jgi:hypothetical protein